MHVKTSFCVINIIFHLNLIILQLTFFKSAIGLVSTLQGLFVPYACVGSGDPVSVLYLFHNKYSRYRRTIYCNWLCTTSSLPKLGANYYRLPTTVQLRAAHEQMLPVQCLTVDWLQILYCTYFRLNCIFWDRSTFGHTFTWLSPKLLTTSKIMQHSE